jgi:hypothetical protein
LLYLHSLLPSECTAGDGEGRKGLFSFSSCPSSLDADALAAPEISLIPAESFAVPFRSSSSRGGALWPRMRDLVPGGWTVLVSLVSQWARRSGHFHRIRYAFVRPRHGRTIAVDPSRPPPTPQPPDAAVELEPVGLVQFLAITAPEVDLGVVERCLDGLVDELFAAAAVGGILPPGPDPLSVLSQAEAADMLRGFLDESMLVNRRLRLAMEEDPKGALSRIPWPAELAPYHPMF